LFQQLHNTNQLSSRVSFHNKIKCNNKTASTQIKVIKIKTKTNINNNHTDHHNKTKDTIQVCHNNKWEAINNHNNNTTKIKVITIKVIKEATNQNQLSTKTKETATVACTTNKTTTSTKPKEEIKVDSNLNTTKELPVDTRNKEGIKIKTLIKVARISTNKEIATNSMDGRPMIKAS